MNFIANLENINNLKPRLNLGLMGNPIGIGRISRKLEDAYDISCQSVFFDNLSYYVG
jgi:hypothetical protein